MKRIVVASTNKNAGKTSIILGLSKILGGKIGYLKPLGDRLLYQKKRQWDHDSSLMTNLIGIQENPEDITIGFDHSKLRYMYDENGIKEKLDKIIKTLSDREILFVESGRSLSYGISIYLDPVSVAKYTNSKLIIITSGSDDAIVDNIFFIQKYIKNEDVDFAGVIINKVHDINDFKNSVDLKKTGTNIIGILPLLPEITYPSVALIADKLFAKVIAGEGSLDNVIKQIAVGAMSASSAINLPIFKSQEKLVITSGDRTDMIVAAIETKSSAIVLTNNVLPPANIIAKAEENKIPLLMVNQDTHEAAKQIDMMQPLITKTESGKVDLIAETVKKHLNIKGIIG